MSRGAARNRPTSDGDRGEVLTASPSLGVDLGGTKVVAGLVGENGTVLRHSGRQLHRNDGPTGVLRSVLRTARSLLDDLPEPPVAVGISVAAQVDARTGTVVHAPNLRWRDVPLAARMSEELGLPVVVLNDARAATFAEWRWGAGAQSKNFFCLIMGTGVGGSAVIDGRLAAGGANALGEVGHLTVVSGGRRCHCPNFGCLEAYVGGWAIADRAREAIRAEPALGAALLATAGRAENVTAKMVVQLHRRGDLLCHRLLADTERILADGVVGIVNAFNPSVLAMAGGILAGLPELIPVVESAVRARCQPPAASVRIVPARFGEDAPLIGAAEFARAALVAGRPRDPPRGRISGKPARPRRKAPMR